MLLAHSEIFQELTFIHSQLSSIELATYLWFDVNDDDHINPCLAYGHGQ